MNRWDNQALESMYDKTLLDLETSLIKEMIPLGASICDAGCGEGEGTLEYSKVGDVDGFDKSAVRLEMASKRGNTNLFRHDVLERLDKQYDVVISQRLLINLSSWEDQKKAIRNLIRSVKPNGKLILSEGSIDGMKMLNELRGKFSLNPIPMPEHNQFMDDMKLRLYIESIGLKYIQCGSLGTYYALTRAILPALRDDFHWSSPFNKICAKLSLGMEEFARVKIWAFE